MTAHEHQLHRETVRWRGVPVGCPAIYCLVIGCPLIVVAPPGMPDYSRAGTGRW